MDARKFLSGRKVFIMKKLMTLALAAGMLLGAATGASAIDFKAKGQWLMGFSAGDGSLVSHTKAKGASSNKAADTDDIFGASQRLRLQLDAVASEALSGTVFFEIGDTYWGKAGNGGALGADQKIVELKNAYIDWMVPNTDLKFRMGIQGIQLPNVAGGSAILDDDVAAVTASYQFNENVALTAMWARPYNDNYDARADRTNYQDNMDLFALMVPLTFDGVKVTPWAMYGMAGANANTLTSTAPYARYANGGDAFAFDPSSTSKAYGSMFWAGLPISLTLWDPLNVELDINYGYVESMGRYEAERYDNTFARMGDTKREGWLVKALVEYKMDWGTPGIFGWYASGDDGNVKNGSERMPSVSGCGNFMSFMGDGNYGWSTSDSLYDRNLTYAGTWGIGLRVHDLSFVEDLKHSFRVAYWGGTNSPSMAKYVGTSYGWQNFNNEKNFGEKDGPYLTTNDGLLEFNLVNSYQIYENLEANLELGYIVNMVDDDTWKRSYRNDSYKKQDAWKAQLIFAYSF